VEVGGPQREDDGGLPSETEHGKRDVFDAGLGGALNIDEFTRL
jgi:hypothetical protein